MESKQQVTRPFWISTCGGGWAYLHSSSDREHLLRANSRHTSSVSHLESLPPICDRNTSAAAGLTSAVAAGLTRVAAGFTASMELDERQSTKNRGTQMMWAATHTLKHYPTLKFLWSQLLHNRRPPVMYYFILQIYKRSLMCGPEGLSPAP